MTKFYYALLFDVQTTNSYLILHGGFSLFSPA